MYSEEYCSDKPTVSNLAHCQEHVMYDGFKIFSERFQSVEKQQQKALYTKYIVTKRETKVT